MPTVLAAALACAASSPPAVLTPPGLRPIGAPVAVRIAGARPGATVTVDAQRPDVWGRPIVYASRATFVADACGRVSLGAGPSGGDWTGADPRAFLWSMKPTKAVPTPDWRASEVRISADVDGDGRPDARGVVRFDADGAATGETPLGPEHPGAFIVHPAAGAVRPAIILLGGSEGGDSGARSHVATFVARGYAAVVLPYYQPDWGGGAKIAGLPAAFADIPLDRIESVLALLRARGDVGRVGLYGVSKGAEFALAAASRMPGIAAVAAIVPSDVIWEGWGAGTREGESSSFSWNGRSLPFLPYQGMTDTIAKLSRREPATMRDPHDAGRAANPGRVAAARIEVERIAAPVLVAGGSKDQVWDSGSMTQAIAATRRARGLPTVALVFPDAGHSLSGSGDIPAAPTDARAQSVVYAATMRFFDDALKDGGSKAELASTTR